MRSGRGSLSNFVRSVIEGPSTGQPGQAYFYGLVVAMVRSKYSARIHCD